MISTGGPTGSARDIGSVLQNAATLHREGQLHEAEALYRAVLFWDPEQFDALHLLGYLEHQKGRHSVGLELIDRAIAINPSIAAAHSNRALILLALKRPEDALLSCNRALVLRPDNIEALSNRGIALLDLARPEQALASFEEAIALKPDFADALDNRGNALRAIKRYAASAAAFAELVTKEPGHPGAHGNMFHDKLRTCDWSDYAATAMRLALEVDQGKKSELPFSFLAHSGDPALQLKCARDYVANNFPASRHPISAGRRYRHDKIRLAYLSADFHEHATAYLMAGLFEAHDRSKFEVSAISFGPRGAGEVRQRLERAFDRFVDGRRNSDREVAELLAKSEIDIAVDLKGITTGARFGIFSHRGAPLQVSYLGYPGTTGAEYIDYVVADRHVIPTGHERHYSEKVVRLPGTYQVNDSKRPISEYAPTRSELKLPERGFVFCCFNNSYKINPAVFDIWMRLLRCVDGSVLWLLENNADATSNLRREAEQRGVAAERLIFAPVIEISRHLARHRQGDLVLDTLPYNAHTTASDALWAGVPILTCAGETFASRVAGSLLHAVGMPELITHDLQTYEAMALKLATAPGILAELRSKLVRNRLSFALFDTDRFRRHLEAAYVTMYERYQQGEPPMSFDVPPLQSAISGGGPQLGA